MSECREVNTVDSLLALIAYTRGELARDVSDADEGAKNLQHARDALQGVHAELCVILSSLLAAPVNGKFLVRRPVETTPPEEQARSVQRHFVAKFKGVSEDALSG